MNLKTNYIETGLHVPHLGLEGAPEQHGVSQASRRVVQGLGGGDQGGHVFSLILCVFDGKRMGLEGGHLFVPANNSAIWSRPGEGDTLCK
eukprot:scaffold265009_cov18-Tisochrysis_lutea.AAC.1